MFCGMYSEMWKINQLPIFYIIDFQYFEYLARKWYASLQNIYIMENRVKIFLVDDDLFSLNVCRQHIENLGYNDISLFLNGTICLNNLYQKPTIVFLDHNMDDLTGFEVLKKIKRYDPNIYVVILSAQESMKIAVDALKYGAFDYIIKGDDEVTKIKNVISRIESIQQELSKKSPSFIKKLLSVF